MPGNPFPVSSCLGFAFVPIWTGLSWGGGRCSGAHVVGTGDRSGVLAVAVAMTMTAVPLLLLVAVPIAVVVAVVESRWVVAGVTAGVGIGQWEWR